MVLNLLQILLILGFPALALWLNKRYKLPSVLSPVILCYVFGIFLTNLFYFPVNKEVSKTITEASVLLGIPMLLFSTDFMKWLRLAKSTIFSFFLAVIGVIIASTVATILFAANVPDASKVAGMMVGVYTGGTPNMNAIGLALKVPHSTFITLNAIDFMLGACYLFLLLSVMKSILDLFLPPFKSSDSTSGKNEAEELQKAPLSPKRQVFDSTISVLLSILIAGISVGVSWLFLGKLQTALIILTVTTLGIGSSFVTKIRGLDGSYDTGQYMLLVFCVAIGSLANLWEIVQTGGILFAFVAAVMFGAIVIHFLLAAIFRIDRDTVMITHTAGIYGPAFVGPVAQTLNNREIMVSGLTTGLVGYAIGNYAGIGLAYILAKYIVL